jgi:hypothetical protein
MRAAAVLLFITLGSSAAWAQRPQTGQGFWIGFGFGAGSARGDCEGCDFDAGSGATAYLKLGGTLSPRLLLGADVTGWVGKAANASLDTADVTVGFVTAAVYWYPSPSSGLFLKGGLGYFTLAGDANTGERLESASAAIVLGIGYDIRVGRMLSVSPVLTFAGSGKSGFDVDGFRVADDFTGGLATLQVGVTFH